MKFFDQIRRPKFGRGGGSAEVGTMSQLWDFFFFDGFPKDVDVEKASAAEEIGEGETAGSGEQWGFMLLFETEKKVEERDVKDSGELEKEDNSVCVLLMMT